MRSAVLRIRFVAIAWLLASCAANSGTSGSVTDSAVTADAQSDASTADTGAADTAVDTGTSGPAAPIQVAGCPNLQTGRIAIQAGGFTRHVRVFPPADPVGKPVIFLWHGLGDTASNFSAGFSAKTRAVASDVTIIVPEACYQEDAVPGCTPGLFTWSSTGNSDPDAALFDTTLACLDQQWQIDRSRVYTIGFSAGALWSTWLLMHRSDYLAAAVTFSGGIIDNVLPYLAPTYNLPVLTAWGGDTDQFANGLVDFNQATATLRADLRKDGHFVLACNHGLGHTVPPQGPDFALKFVLNHAWKDGVSPYATAGLGSDFPKYCAIEP